jgi:glycerate-2-kinase
MQNCPERFVRNRKELVRGPNAMLRGHALDILEAALDRAVPGKGTYAEVCRRAGVLTIGGQDYDLNAYARVLVLGVGKASFPIAAALEDILGERLDGGLLVVKRGETRRLTRVRVLDASHPLPDESSLRAGRELLTLAEDCTERDLVLAPVTGGATALAVVPHPGLTLRDLRTMHELVLKSGADIWEMNIVRRHLCRLKGGGFVMAAQPATVVTFSLDTALTGMPWPDMCLPDSSTFADAVELLQRLDIWEKTPKTVRDFLLKAQGLQHLETVKSFEGVNARMIWVGDASSMCRAAADKAAAIGYTPLILASRMHGEARETGVCLSGIAQEIIRYGSPVSTPCAVICSGESPVTVSGGCGRGGPNQELVISFAAGTDARREWVCAAIDTDGTDGPTDVAGGLVDNHTASRAAELGVSLVDALYAHDSGTALSALRDSIHTGHTGTNMQHLRIILINGTDNGGRP